jgi:fermentation-respiration switch protein FrsA (DUF1100 family)
LRPYLIAAALAAVAVLVAVVVLARLVENSMIFFPARYPAGEWDAEAVGARDVFFDAADGVTLHAWWFEAEPPVGSEARTEPPAGAAVLLFAHGNAGNLSGRVDHARAFAREGISVLVFDYRGYGRSEGSADEAGIYADIDAAYLFLTDEWRIVPDRIVLLGRSLGSAPASRLSTRVPHAALVLVSPMPSAMRMTRRMFGGLPIDLLIRSRFPVVDWVAERSTPLLVVHGDRDEIIPPAYGREVYEAAAEPKRFLALPAAGHNDILSAGGRDYVDTVAAFVHAAVAGR